MCCSSVEHLAIFWFSKLLQVRGSVDRINPKPWCCDVDAAVIQGPGLVISVDPYCLPLLIQKYPCLLQQKTPPLSSDQISNKKASTDDYYVLKRSRTQFQGRKP